MQICSMALDGRTGRETGRALLAEMYRAKTGQDLPEICIAPRGKPYFREGGLYFSITHTKRRVFCALSEKPVGIDAEETDRKVDLRLADKILSPAERQAYEAAPDKRAALLRLWVLKEASAKLSGEGLRGYPNTTDFSPDDPRVTETDGCWLAVMEFEKPHF